MAALITTSRSSAGLEITPLTFSRWHSRLPPKTRLQLGVRVGGLFPESVPTAPVEGRRQLALRPVRIFLPQAGEDVARKMRNIDRPERLHVLLVQSQKRSARGQIVIYHVEDFAINARRQPGKYNRIGAVVDIR